MGSVRGEWGIDDDGRRMFVGKWIDVTGEFEGFVKGTWVIHPGPFNHAGHANGRFRGRIFNADREPIGEMRGHFKAGDYPRAGFFAGQWCLGCDRPPIDMPDGD